VTADDFGLNSRVNEAVEALYHAGLLTQASLMVNEPGAEEAVRIARRNPGLLVGLHLSLCCGRASRPSVLTDADGWFPASPAWAGLRYAFTGRLRGALEAEIAAQFEAYAALGLPPVYWDGHTHLHLHPTVFDLTLPLAVRHGFRAVRLVRDPGWGVLPFIFRGLSRAARRKAAPFSIRFTDRVFGLRRTGRMNTKHFFRLLRTLPDGWTEIYCHPGAEAEWLDGQGIAAFARMEGVCLRNARDLVDREA